MPSAKDQLQEAMKAAMRAQEKPRRDAMRLILAAIKQYEVDQRQEVDDKQFAIILSKLKKQREESISHYQEAGREDLVKQEQFELDIIKQYLPEQLSEDEIEKHIQDALQASSAGSLKDMGKVMSILTPKLQGRADMGQVSARIKQLLS